MSLLALTNTLSHLQVADRPQTGAEVSDLYIAMVYGFCAREHMQRNMLRLMRESGYPNAVMYGHLQASQIANDLQAAAAKGKKIVVIGYSQGGLEAVRVAKELNNRSVDIDLLVTIAGGGKGRLWPHRWADDLRTIPANVAHCLNYFSASDVLGTDYPYERNLAVATDEAQKVENIFFEKEERVSHLAITKCYPFSRVHPRVSLDLLQRIQAELVTLTSNR